MVRKILRYPHPVLADRSAPIEEITDEIRDSLIPDMIETMYEKEGVGLAAPQVGKAVRLICVDPTGPKERAGLMVLVNPEIVETSGEQESEEACLSVFEASCKITRAERIRVRGRNEKDEEVEYEFEGYPAVIFQHEIDHLNGTLIIDHVGRLKRSMYDKRVKKWQKQGKLD